MGNCLCCKQPTKEDTDWSVNISYNVPEQDVNDLIQQVSDEVLLEAIAKMPYVPQRSVK